MFRERPKLGFALALTLLIGLAALLRAFPDEFKFRNGGDAVRAMEWSGMVKDRGLSVYPELAQLYIKKWVGFSTPTRWGWIGLCALARTLFPHTRDVYTPMVALAWLSGVLCLLPLAWWLRGKIPDGALLLSLLLCATGPIERGWSHFPMPDSLCLLMTLAFFAALASYLERPSTWTLLLIAFFSAANIAIKETSVIFGVAGVALVILEHRRSKVFHWKAALAISLGGVITALVTLLLVGGGATLWTLTKLSLHGAVQSSGAMPYVSGPYFTYLVALMVVSPALMVVALGSYPTVLRATPYSDAMIQVALVTVVSWLLFSCFTFTLRYVMFVDVGLRVVAACAVWRLWADSRKWVALVTLGLLVGHDLALHAAFYGRDQIYDPSIWAMTRQLRMIP